MADITIQLLHHLRGPFNFLRLVPEEIQRLMPLGVHTLPIPQSVYLEDESATPLHAFPTLLSDGVRQLSTAVEQYLRIEEQTQIGILRRESFDRKLYGAAWERYRGPLSQAIENVTLSSYGRNYQSIFWLYHSLQIARLLKETPRWVLRYDLEMGRKHGDQIKYRVFDKLHDRLLSTTYDVVNRLATDTDEMEEELFPGLLRQMLDNVLIFTEDHIGPDLAELGSYFSGYLRVDGRDLRNRLQRLWAWHGNQLAADGGLRNFAAYLLQGDPQGRSDELLRLPGYATFLSALPDYNPRDLLPSELVQVWENLLVKLKEFELFHGLRRLLLPVEQDGGHLVARGLLGRALGGSGRLRLSPTTRPLDFMAPWVVNPQVDRYGLIYDITDFSQIVSVLHRSGTEIQDQAFRMMFRFQRRVNRLATSHGMKLEKYLGDGAFYSSRHPQQLLVGAIRLQRFYDAALKEGFPFDRGLRIAINHGRYRLIPFHSGHPGEPERYEFFGHGLVELTRLVTGKATREIEEVKNLLINQGYPEHVVQRFFAPLVEQKLDLVDKQAESRRFYAYINQNGTLVNEGIVATEAFIAQLEREVRSPALYRAEVEARSYVLLPLDDGGSRLMVGLRKLGVANFKGLEDFPVYEVVDGDALELSGVLEELSEVDLTTAIDREFAWEMDRRRSLQPGGRR